MSLLTLKAECLMFEAQFDKSLVVLTTVTRIYNKSLNRRASDKENVTPPVTLSVPPEVLTFGVDEYIKVNASIAECY